MNFDSLLGSFLSNQQAVLPTALAQFAGLYVAWALMLVWGVSAMTRRWPLRYRGSVLAAVALLTLVPGPSSPAYWLGLAFQSPSVTSVVLAVGYLSFTGLARPLHSRVEGRPNSLVACAVGAGLGWVLLLDTLAWWPVSIYAWGFSPVAVAILALTLAIGWAIWGGARTGRWSVLGFAVPALVLALFVLTRWPTGNVWDALIDPWLWVGFQGVLLISGLRAWRLRGAPAIQA
jgi:hypothetical protein